METSEYVAIIASLFALLSAIYARRTWKVAKSANNIARMNTLLTLKQHYSKLQQTEYENSKTWLDWKNSKVSDGYTETCFVAAADYQKKHRHVSEQLEQLKSELLNNKI
ncbi:hypothetical protein DS885_04725 [Psychromonas sp. B3M02]|uniref:hypothetical protein n=1 Tax=Psychromonas sp. B3M02 TaxID=2267226 RepID=UPI000DEA7A3A|nr:hypothetical protein [Psychromonas sp. B3M02]RBW47105.1 hypothetical protein DS885_04725 [Psychromonas sp. B3M02]